MWKKKAALCCETRRKMGCRHTEASCRCRRACMLQLHRRLKPVTIPSRANHAPPPPPRSNHEQLYNLEESSRGVAAIGAEKNALATKRTCATPAVTSPHPGGFPAPHARKPGRCMLLQSGFPEAVQAQAEPPVAAAVRPVQMPPRSSVPGTLRRGRGRVALARYERPGWRARETTLRHLPAEHQNRSIEEVFKTSARELFLFPRSSVK